MVSTNKKRNKKHKHGRRWLFLHRLFPLYKRNNVQKNTQFFKSKANNVKNKRNDEKAINVKMKRKDFKNKAKDVKNKSFMLSKLVLKRVKYPFFFFMPYYASKVSIPFSVVTRSTTKVHIARNIVRNVSIKHKLALMFYLLIDARRASSYVSSTISVIFLRHVMLSVMS